MVSKEDCDKVISKDGRIMLIVYMRDKQFIGAEARLSTE